jgi:type II secretory pathway pseudopilin PulG
MDNQNENNNFPPNNPEPNPSPTPPPSVEQPQPAYPQPAEPVVAGQEMPQSAPQPAPQMTPQTPQQIAATDPGRGLGIASLVTAVLGIHLVALILGIIGLNKTKKAGYPTNIPALIGIIWSAIVMFLIVPILVILVLSNFQGAQSKGRDTVARNDINSTYQKLEEYYNENGLYPVKFTAETFPGIDAGALIDESGNTYYFGDSTITNSIEAEAQSLPTIEQRYQYLPYNCIDIGCSGYIVRAYLENPDTFTSLNVYTKYALNDF